MTKDQLKTYEVMFIKAMNEWFYLEIRRLEAACRSVRDEQLRFEASMKSGELQKAQDAITSAVRDLGKFAGQIRFDLATRHTQELATIVAIAMQGVKR